MDLFPISEIAGFSATQSAHDALSSVLRAGDWVVDATAGNGHDTAFLAEAVHPGGRVFACDRQTVALAATRARLLGAGLVENVELIECDHANLNNHLPENAKGRLQAVIFNLGYLPGGSKSITTEVPSTLRALESLSACLQEGGLLVVVAYRGHPGGEEEFTAVHGWFTAQSTWIRPTLFATSTATRRPPPVLFLGIVCSVSREWLR